VRESRELAVWLSAIDPLLDEADAKELAQAQPKLLEQALDSADESVLAVAYTAALRAERSEIAFLLGRLLDSDEQILDPDSRRQAAAYVALARVGPGPLEAKLRAFALRQKQQHKSLSDHVLLALLHSDDPTTAELFRHFLPGSANGLQRFFLADRLQDARFRKVWLRELLLEWVRQPAENFFGALRCDWAKQADIIGKNKLCQPAFAWGAMKVEAIPWLAIWGAEVERDLVQAHARASSLGRAA
jgi:hypothetical protein